MPHKEPKGDGARQFYKLQPAQLQKALREPFPNGVICPLCVNDGKESCERTIKGKDPKPGFCPSFEPPPSITFCKVQEALNVSARNAQKIFGVIAKG